MAARERVSSTNGIRSWPVSERPRERLLANGARVLSDAELLAVIIRTGSGGETALDLAREILSRVGSIGGLERAGLAELQGIPGLGPAKTAQLKAALEIARRRDHPEDAEKSVPLRTSRDAFRYVRSRFVGARKELFECLLLDARNRARQVVTVSEGSLTGSIVHPREAFSPAVRESAAAVLFVHNHPSGDPTPSHDDIQLTRRLVQTGEILGIPVLDHLIVGEGDAYTSLADLGHVPPSRTRG